LAGTLLKSGVIELHEHGMKLRNLIWVVGLLTTHQMFSQIAAPTAFSNYTGCAHNTCTWVPDSAQKTFQRGDFNYLVDATGAETNGTFVLKRKGEVLLHTALQDLSASVSVVWSQKNDAFAITWSDGGAIGGFHVRVFQIHDRTVEEVPASEKAIASFKLRHCRSRGNNVQAYRWLNSDQLLIVTSVYPTGDCGSDGGHMEGYVVHVQDGSIVRHLNPQELKADMREHPE
jgi:hypothetical protein